METLAEIYKRHCVTGPDVGHGDKGGTHSYIEEYEWLLAPFRQGSSTIMEIGLALGLSMQMWQEYFAPSCKLVGVDLSICFDRALMQPNVELITANATKASFPAKLHGYTFDVVIDDGSHMAQDQEATFRLLAPLMNKGGLYIIEDILAVDAEHARFQSLHTPCEIMDLRWKKGRFDDVLIVYRF